MSDGSFDRVISEHLALAERNRRLERAMPLDQYRENDGQPGHEPKTEPSVAASAEDSISWWDSSEERAAPTFDWGDD